MPKAAEEFVDCTTLAGAKRHFADRSWPKLTLCGNVANNHGATWVALLPACKQCGKSRTRQIEGRPH